MRWFRFSIIGIGRAPARRASTMPTAVATTSTQPMARKRKSVCSLGRHGRGVSSRPERQQRRPRAFQERRLLLAVAQPQRHAEGDGAEERHGDQLALRHDAVEVGDPDRHHLDARPRQRQPVDAALEGKERQVGQVARAFREEDQRGAFRRAPSPSAGSGRACAFSASRSISTALKTRVADEAANGVLQPIVGGGNRPRASP